MRELDIPNRKLGTAEMKNNLSQSDQSTLAKTISIKPLLMKSASQTVYFL